MHTFTSHREGARRYFANFDLPTHPLCWLRGHRAKAEMIEGTYTESWLLVTCRTCGIRHSDPYMGSGKHLGRVGGREEQKAEAQEALARQHHAARTNNEAFARVRDGRDGYGHHRLELSLEVTDGSSYRKPGLNLLIGDRWSETPFDGSLHGRNRSAYFSIGGVGNRLAHWLTKGEKREVRVGAGWKADR